MNVVLELTSVTSKMSILLILCVLCISTTCAIRAAPIYKLEDAEKHFETFIKRHGKVYADENEKKARFEIFKVNLEELNRLNDGQDDAVFGLTLFMDLTHDEFIRMYTCYGGNSTDFVPCPFASVEEIQDEQAPDSFDWRQQNAVTPIKSQEGCGSCYAFSAIANIESQYAIKHRQQLDLSEQHIVDCDATSNGCNSGWISNSFQYLIKAGGAVNENDYPYRNRVEKCQFDQSKAIVRLADCRSYNLRSQEQLKQLLHSTGPISITIKSSGITKYDGGLITDQMCNTGVVNHAVLLVGYGFHSNGQPIWIIKNSWGTNWGDKGYAYVVRGENFDSCGLLNTAMASSILA